jgi:hypothetical protein
MKKYLELGILRSVPLLLQRVVVELEAQQIGEQEEGF